MSEQPPKGSPEYMRLQAKAVDRDLAEHGVDYFLGQSGEQPRARQAALAMRVEAAGIVLQRIRDHGPWFFEEGWAGRCLWCGAVEGQQHAEGCLWLEVVAVTDRPDADLPGGQS